MTNFVFYLAIAFIFTHELDAIYHHEWRIFFAAFKQLGDTTAYQIFTALHIPLFALLLWFVANPTTPFAIVLDSFLIIHIGLHLLFRNHPNYEFEGVFSNVLIWGAGIFGALHLLLNFA